MPSSPEPSSFSSRWSLTGQTALVTGGTRGIGRAMVEELCKLGAHVYTCARNEEALNRSLKEWEAEGFVVKGSVCDTSRREDREALFERVSSCFGGKLNILVNNVGTTIVKPAVECTAEDFTQVFSTNFESAYHCAQLAHPLLQASGKGNVIFVSSVAAVVPVLFGSLYAASKGAINHITKNLACEWAKDGIRVNTVAPWVIKTYLSKEITENEALTREAIGRTPLCRFGEPYEVASVAAFLCLPTAGYVTGQVIIIDEGKVGRVKHCPGEGHDAYFFVPVARNNGK